MWSVTGQQESCYYLGLERWGGKGRGSGDRGLCAGRSGEDSGRGNSTEICSFFNLPNLKPSVGFEVGYPEINSIWKGMSYHD